MNLSRGQERVKELYLMSFGVAVVWERKGGETVVLDPREVVVLLEDGTNEKLTDFVYEKEE